MINNIFQDVIDNKELYEFFTGKDKYFILNRDTDEHSYLLNVNIYINVFINETEDNLYKFQMSFIQYIKSSNANDINDLNALLRNIYSIALCEQRNKIPESSLIKNQDDKVYNAIYDFILSCKKLCIGSLKLIKDYQVYFDRINKYLMSDILKKIIGNN